MEELSKAEWQEEMIADAHSERAERAEEERYESKMTSDMDFCLEELNDYVIDAESAIQLLAAKLNSYGYEMSFKETKDLL